MNGNNTAEHLRRWVWIGFAVAACVAVAGYFMRSLLLGPEVNSFTVSRSELVQTVVASGRVETPARVEISSQIMAEVIDIPVAEGQTVRAQQLLIKLRDADEVAALEQARASVNQAEARLRQMRELTQPVAEQTAAQAGATLANAEKQYARSKELADKGFVGRSQLDDATRALEVARSQVVAARAQVASTGPAGADSALAKAALQQAHASARVVEAKLAETAIHAPVDGILISRAVDRGDVAQPGKTLMVLSPTGATQLVVQIDEKNLRYLRVGQRALAQADAYPAERFDATLAYINPGIDAQRGSVEVKLNVEKPPADLRQDMTVSVDIEVARHANALVLPVDAVRDAAGAAPWVLAANNGRAERRAIKIGVRGNAKLEVLEGLSEHDRVLKATGVAIKDGERVRAITP